MSGLQSEMPSLTVDPSMPFQESPIQERQWPRMEQDIPKGISGTSHCPYCHRPMNGEHSEERRALQRDDARFKAVWNKEMGDIGERSVYRTVSALLISWDDEAGDLKTGEEVERLRDVLESKYKFEVRDKRLDAQRPAQHQINKHLANFVEEKDDENGLLIVYYAGHGIPGNIPGGLKLAGSRNPEHHESEKKRKLNEIVWHKAEHLIRDAWGDVLVIFDCCAAGDLGRDMRGRGSWARRAFEFLGATTAEETTPEPGPDSFTSALIWALQELVTDEGFTTSELLRKIHHAPHFPQSQYPVQHERDIPSLKKIVIAPLLKDKSLQKEKAEEEATVPTERLEFLDLRVLLSRHLTEEHIVDIARTLKDTLRTKEMSPVRHIAWGKLSVIESYVGRFRTFARSVSVIKNWSRRTRNKSLTQIGVSPEATNGHVSSKEPNSSPGEPSGPNRKRQRRR